MNKILTLFLVAVLTISCDEGSHQHDENGMHVEEKEIKEATFVHTVFFWMKEDISVEESNFFEAELEKLGQCPTINTYKWGKPAGTPREVVDNSYGYAWIVDFTNSANQDAYQVEPIHLDVIENCQDLWTKVQVYDTLLN